MKKIFSLMALAIMTALTVNAQKIQVVDSEGNGIPLVSVLTEGGTFIGTTNLDGVLDDVKGAQRVAITHVAYKPQLVTISSLTDGKVRMEDIGYDLNEVVVRPKPYIYIETYYRVYVYRNDSLGYFLSGIMPNIYDPQTKKHEHGSYYQNFIEYYGSFWASTSWAARAHVRGAGQVSGSGLISKKQLKEKYFVETDDSNPNLWIYSNAEGKMGQMVRNGSQALTTLDGGKIQMYANKVKGETKMLQKREDKDYQYQYTRVGKFKEDEEESNATEFLMETDHWEYTDKKGHVKFIIETYATDRSYMDKNEWKARKKDLKQEFKHASTLKDMEPYEQQHHIPALPATVMQAIEKLEFAVH